MDFQKLIVMIFLSLFAYPISGADQTESKIFQGFIQTFQYLLTPHHSDEEIQLPREILLEKTKQKLKDSKEDFIQNWKKGQRYNPDQNKYYKVIPKFLGNLEIGKTLSIEGSCFEDAWGMATKNEEDGSVTVTINLEKPNALLCRAAFLVSVDSDTQVAEYILTGKKEMNFLAPTDQANAWDLYERGPRLFLYPIPIETAIANLAATLALFEPCLTESVADVFAEMNLEFLENYVGITMPERVDVPEVIVIDKNAIHSGDTFHTLRLHGLGPMIAWAMGAATSHVVIAVWKDAELFLCESNTDSRYWPINGIQCNPYDDWMEYGRRNSYHVVWAPLARNRVDTFNETAAWEFIDDHLGNDYGWEVVLTGCLDSHEGNRLCADSAGQMCTEKEHFEMIFSVVEKVSVDAARVFKAAIMQRAGVAFDLPIVEAYYKAQKEDGIAPGDVHIIPESDDWIYPTYKYGEPHIADVSICNVFTCKVLKAAGIFAEFGDEISCGEISVNDNYRMKIYEDNFERPTQCVEADPDNPLCQLLGKYSLRLDSQPGVLPRYNYVPLHSNFGQNCPSLAPDYLAPVDC